MPSKEYRLRRAIEGNPIQDKRKRSGDRHREGYQRPKQQYTKRQSKWERRSIVAWDGEGANLDTGEHVYNLLANSHGDKIVDMKGLPTLRVFDFMIRQSNENDINVIYGGSYDVNMILRDLPKEKLQDLWDNGKTYWASYRIFYASRKKFTLQLIKDGKVKKTFVLWDVIGYFQSTFVVACQKWLGNFEVLTDIQKMKEQRSEFKSEDIDDIIEYNRKECVLLVQLMTQLFDSIDEAELQLMRYDGAGSIAAALLKKFDVRLYKGEVPKQVNRWAQHAYSGGRIEAIKCGTTVRRTRIFRYDINSAYPSACLSLPSYVGATWTKDQEWDGTNNSLCMVTFHFQKDAPFYPLWYRDSSGSISYPRQGKGVYWGAEVQNLFKYYEEGKDFVVEWAINCELADETMPFHFLHDLFELRKEFKARGSMASESLKLGMNSVYGKIVQQAGYREGRIPTYHQLLWGGQITASTRAKLFDVAMRYPTHVISFATDAVFTTHKLDDLSIGPELGQWTADEFSGMTIVQAGVYFLQHNDEWQEKYRGFDKGSLSRNEIVRCWKEGTEHKASLTRFVGLGSALMANDFSIWRTWPTTERNIDIRPTGKRIPGDRQDYHTGLRATKACPNITPDVISSAYAIEWVDGKRGSRVEVIDGVPLETLVDEMEDGVL